MAKKNFLESNPLFNTPEAEGQETKGKGKPRKEDLVREPGAQEGLTVDYTRATFILRVETLNALKDYAYTNRITIKDALEAAVTSFLDKYKEDGGELLSHKK